MRITITTNNHPRALYSFHDLPEKERSDFDYIEGDDQYAMRLFRYRGAWYDYYEFSRVSPDTTHYQGWDGVQPQSYFDAILIRYVRDDFGDETVIVAHTHW